MNKQQQRANAINTFIATLKSEGLWDSVKASCIMAGWDNISGALTPLVGAAPTNVSGGFTNSDYDNGIGLKGDGTSYLDSGRQASDDPLNDFHLSVHITEASNLSQGMYIGGQATNPNDIYNAGGFIFVRSRGAADTNGVFSSTGFIGHSRSESSAYISRNNTISVTHSISSIAADAQNIFVFARNQSGSVNSIINGRLSFYSIGEALDLAVLDSAVSTLVTTLRGIDEQGMDADALTYIRAVETADGGFLETPVKIAIDNLVKGLKADNLWDSIKASCLLCGPRTLNGALVPLVGGAPTNVNNNFVEADYNRETGLVGNGSTKYLDSGRANNADPLNDRHYSVYLTAYNANVSQTPFGSIEISPSYTVTDIFMPGDDTARVYSVSAVSATDYAEYTSFNSLQPTFVGATRSNAAGFSARAGGVNKTVTAASVRTTTGNETVFGRNNAGSVDSRSGATIAFYSIGESLDLEALDNRITQYVTAIGAAI